jgi:hypothetical protein
MTQVTHVIEREVQRQSRRMRVVGTQADAAQIASSVTATMRRAGVAGGVVFICVADQTFEPRAVGLLAEDFDIAYPPRGAEPPAACVHYVLPPPAREQLWRAFAHRGACLLLVLSDAARGIDALPDRFERRSQLFDALRRHRRATQGENPVSRK